MTLQEQYVKTGNWLFINRGWLPLLAYPIVFIAIFFDYESIQIDPNNYTSFIFLGISLFGIFIRAMVVGFTPENTSGRNTKEGQVADSLNTKGMYSMVRHPLYVGNFFMWLGIILSVGITWVSILIVLLYWIYYEKIMCAEENFLTNKFGNVYIEWANGSSAVVVNLSKWKSPEVDFSLKNVIKREYHGLFYTVLSFVILHFIKEGVMYGWDNLLNNLTSIIWLYIFGGTIVFSIIVRIMSKMTSLLDVDNR